MDCKMDTGGLVIKLHISRIDHYHWALRLREDWKSFYWLAKSKQTNKKKSNSQPKWCKHRTIHTSLNLNPWGSSERTERGREREGSRWENAMRRAVLNWMMEAYNLPAPVWAVWRRSCRTLPCRLPRRSYSQSSEQWHQPSAGCRRFGGSFLGRLKGEDTRVIVW